MLPPMKIIIFEFLCLIKYFLFIISILGILVQAHRKKLVQASEQQEEWVGVNSGKGGKGRGKESNIWQRRKNAVKTNIEMIDISVQFVEQAEEN